MRIVAADSAFIEECTDSAALGPEPPTAERSVSPDFF